MRGRLPQFLMLVMLGLLAIMLGNACHRPSPGPTPGDPTRSPRADTDPGPKTSPDPFLTATPVPPAIEGAMILSVERDVSLKRQGAESFVPIVAKVWFAVGDVLQVGQTAFANVLCADRICRLGTGNYTTCCSTECAVRVAMMRVTSGDAPPVRIAELSPADAIALKDAEKGIRALNLGELTTQFLMTNLYSGWKLKETDDELNRLNIQLAKPEAKQELRELYLPVMRKTGDLHLKVNRLEDAKKVYELNLNAVSQTNNLNEKAAAHQGLAEVYRQGGDKNQAVHNLEKAKEIYVRKGETESAVATEKQIVNVRSAPNVNKTKVFRAPAAPVKSP